MDNNYHRGQVDLLETLKRTEADGLKTGVLDIRRALKIAKEECQFPELGVVWQDTLEPDSNGIQLCEDDDCVDPQAVGHALVQASFAGAFHCVQTLRVLQAKQYMGSFLTGRFCAYAFLKAIEGGHVDVVKELSKPIASASPALLGYAVATKFKAGHYPFVNEPMEGVSIEWVKKMAAAQALLPKAVPTFLSAGSWELHGPKGSSESVNHVIQAIYKTYFLWRTSMVAATNDQAAVFQELLMQIDKDNKDIAEAGHEKGEAKKLLAVRSKLDGLLYQLVEELSAVQKKDTILYSLWTFIPNGSPNAPQLLAVRPHRKAAGTHCVAQAQNGLWEIQVEVPVLMMATEAGYEEADAIKRLKQLSPIYMQRVRVNVQLVIDVATLPNCIQATVSIKHVRMKVEESIWEEQRLGHFPSHFTLAVTPETTEGGSCTMSNSSSNVLFKVGASERISGHAGVSGFVGGSAIGGVRMTFGGSVAKSRTSTMKTTSWRFEQIQVRNHKGGSYVWNLQAIKGLDFNRLNPIRMGEGQSIWKFGRRVVSNPISELPFTSEGGINFTAASHDDTLTWRFPSSMDGTKLKWTLEGSFTSTYTTTKFWETREATFSGTIEETLKALEVKDKKGKEEGGDGEKKKDKKDKKDKKESGDGDADGEKKKKKDKKDKEDGEGEEGSKKKKKEKKVVEEDEDDDTPVKKPKKKKLVEEDDDEEDMPVKKPKKKTVVEEEDDEEDTPMKKPKKKKAVEEDDDEEDTPVKKSKKKKVVEEEDDEEDEVPAKKKKGKKKPAVEDDDEDNLPVKKVKKKKPVDEEDDEEYEVPMKSKKKKKVVVEDDNDEDGVPVKKSKKKKVVEEEDDEEDEVPAKKKKGKKKPAVEDDDEDNVPVKKVKKKPVDEEDDEEYEVPVKIKKVKKKVVVEDDNDEDGVPVKKSKKKKVVEEEDDEEDDITVTKKGKKKVVVEDEGEDNVPVKKSKKKVVEEEDDEEDEVLVEKVKKGKKIVDKDDDDDVGVTKKTEKKIVVENDDDDEEELPVKKKTGKQKPVEDHDDAEENDTTVQKMRALKVTETQSVPEHLKSTPKLNLRPPPGRS